MAVIEDKLQGLDARLSRRELEVLELVAAGCSTREIAGLLWVTEETVKTHVRRVLRRLGARTRAHAVAIAFRENLWRPSAGVDGGEEVSEDEPRP